MSIIKLIVTDLDNTLLRRDKTVSDYTVDVLKRAHRKGILSAFATARDFRFVTEYITPLTGITPDILISDNGALAYCNGIDIYKKMIPGSIIRELIPEFKLVRCISTEKVYCLSGKYSNDHWSIGKKDTIITDSFADFADDAFYIDGNIDNSSVFLTENYRDIRTFLYSDISLVTVVHRDAAKLNALLTVISYLNIQKNETVVFGDDYSDIDVLSGFNNSIAVANAINECKRASAHLCGDCDEDGVAHWIEENLL